MGDGEQLFLLEVIVESITLSPVIGAMPPKKQVVIQANFGDFATLEIRPDAVGAPDPNAKEGDSKKRTMEYFFGRSFLFPCKPSILINALQKCPLQIVVNSKDRPAPMGYAYIDWSEDFVEMVQSCKDSAGYYVTPVYLKSEYRLDDAKGELVGEVEVFCRLSCFGASIETHIQIVNPAEETIGPGARQFLFKSVAQATTFQCQKYVFLDFINFVVILCKWLYDQFLAI